MTLHDLNDAIITTVQVPPRLKGAPPRSVMFQGRTFVELPDTGDMYEVQKEDAA